MWHWLPHENLSCGCVAETSINLEDSVTLGLHRSTCYQEVTFRCSSEVSAISSQVAGVMRAGSVSSGRNQLGSWSVSPWYNTPTPCRNLLKRGSGSRMPAEGVRQCCLSRCAKR